MLGVISTELIIRAQGLLDLDKKDCRKREREGPSTATWGKLFLVGRRSQRRQRRAHREPEECWIIIARSIGFPDTAGCSRATLLALQ